MIHVQFGAMGTQVEGWCGRPQQETELRSLFEEVEAVCSRFRPTSELSRVNSEGGPARRLSPLLAEVVRQAAEVRSLTDGLVDAGVGGAVAAWGYDRDFSLVEGRSLPPDPQTHFEWKVDGDTLRCHSDSRLDLGGIAKGWTCDQAVERGAGVVVSAGGDLRSAHPGTTVPVLDPWGEVAATLRVGRGALATSSTARRRWTVAGREVSHLIDPRSMAPARTPVVSATVVARTALLAEAGAKATLLHGEDSLSWAAEQDWIISALVVWHDGSVYATGGIEVAS